MSDYYETLAGLIKWELPSPLGSWQTRYNGWRITRINIHYSAIHPRFWFHAFEEQSSLDSASRYLIRQQSNLPALLELIDERNLDNLSDQSVESKEKGG